MQLLLIISLVLAVTLAAPAEEGFFSTKYDNFDVEGLIGNSEQLNSLSQCLVGKGPCSPVGDDIKAAIPEALATTCARCSPNQRELLRKVILAITQNNPQDWEEIKKSVDPNGQYQEAVAKFLSNQEENPQDTHTQEEPKTQGQEPAPQE